MTSLVGLELVALGGYLLWRRDGLPLLVLGALALLLGVALLLPVGGSSLGGLVARRVGFALRRHVGAGGAERARVRVARDHHGQALGVLESAPCLSVVIAVRSRRDRMLVGGDATVVPVQAVLDLARSSGIPIDSVVTIRRPGRDGQEVLVVVRFDPDRAATALAVRGGSGVGVDAALAALLAMVVHEVRNHGLEATPWGPDELAAEVGLVLSGVEGDPARWTEGWTDQTTGPVSHRTAELVHIPASRSLAATAGSGDAVLAVRFAPADGGVRARVLARVSDTTAAGLAAKATQAFARTTIGGRTRAASGRQRTAYLETTVIGGEAAPPASVSTGPSVDGWLPLPAGAADRLAPWLRIDGVPIGRARDGAVTALDLAGSSPRRVLVVGDGLTAGAIVAATARTGHLVAVVTDRPAPWNALGRDPSLAGRVVAVQPGTTALPAGSPALVVVEGDPAAADPWRPAPTALVLRTSLEEVEPDLPGRCGLVVLAGSVAAGTGRAARVAGVSEELLRLAAPGPQESVLVENGEVRVVRLGAGQD